MNSVETAPAAPDAGGVQCLRVFVSSPADVAEERARALAVLQSIAGELGLAHRLRVEPVLWDHPDEPTPMALGESGQQSVDRYKGLASQSDLVIAVFASRLGSPAVGPGGQVIESGTVYEIDLALAAGVPVWVYRRDDPPLPKGHAARRAWMDELERLDAFFDSHRFRDEGGRRVGESSGFEGPAAFEAMLRKHLALEIRRRQAQWDAKHQQAEAADARASERARRPYCVPPRDVDLPLVDHQGRLAQLQALVLAGQHACLVAPPGMGKTLLARMLVDDRDTLLDRFAGVLWMEFGQRPELGDQLRHWAQAVGVPGDVHASLATEDDWLREIGDRIGTRRMLVVLDDIWHVEQAQAVMARLPHAVFAVTTRRDLEVAAELEGFSSRQTLKLKPLDDEESLALLQQHAPAALAMAPRRVQQLVGWAAGLPLALKLMARLLDKAARSDSIDLLDRQFDRFYDATHEVLTSSVDGSARVETHRADERRTLSSILGQSVDALEDDAVRADFLALSVFRPKPYHFDRDMAETICDLADAPATFAALIDLGLLECRTPPGQPTEYTLHPLVQAYADERLPAERKAAYQNRLLDWYGGLIDIAEQEDAGDPYQLWYRYEHDRWQGHVRNWLYYLAKTSEPMDGQVAFLRVYFDAWWWWGFFQSFDFCGKLVSEWSQRHLSKELRARLRIVEQFQQHFPMGMGPRGRRADWARADAALARIHEGVAAYLAGGGSRQRDGQRVLAIIEFARAECAAHGEADVDAGLRLLRTARERLMRPEVADAWSATYLIGYEADYLLMAGRAQHALELADEGLRACDAAPGAPDPEQHANLWRARAMACHALGDDRAAAQAWRCAAVCALAFQAYPEPADGYTVQFFDALAQGFCAQLTLMDPSADATVRMAAAMGRLWSAFGCLPPSAPELARLLAARDPGALRQALLPGMPALHPADNLTVLAQRVSEHLPMLADEVDLAPLAARLQHSRAQVQRVKQTDD